MQSYHNSETQQIASHNIVKVLTNQMRNYMFQKQESAKTYKKPVFLVDDMESTYINMKLSFEYVGDNSTFQKRITSILVIQWIAFSFVVSSIAYLFRTPNFLCRIPLTDIFISCSSNLACPLLRTDYARIDQTSSISITQEFLLYCGNSSFVSFAIATFFFGGFISGYLFSYLSSRYGRRPILLIIIIMAILSMLCCALAPNFDIFLVGFFFSGFCLFGYQTSVYSYIGQISAIRFRTISINMLTMVWAGTPIFLPLLSLIPTWRYMYFFFAGLMIAALPFAYKCFLQSPRFLLSKKCYGQVRAIFEKISVTNHRPPYNFRIIQEIEEQNETYLTINSDPSNMCSLQIRPMFESQARSYNYLDLFKYPSLKKLTIVIMYWWMFRFFMYFGLNLALESILKSGFFLTLMISGAAVIEVLGSFGIPIMTTFLYNKYKLDIMGLALLIITLCCSAMWFIEIDNECKAQLQSVNEQWCTKLVVMIILVMILKFFNTVFFSGLILYYSEVFPTPVRSLGCGFTLTFGRLGTIIVPFYINQMKIRYEDKNALCFMAPFGLLAFIICFIMPYTEIQGMKQKIKEEDCNVFQMIEL